ncbi:MAG: NAD(P)-binding domain-containing protein [Rhodospirillales bacterium]|nr:NAD(P)-binding domain-containing protein [Rhodospirillales bacterium]
MKVGFIGLGIMGRPMAGHLLAGGHELFVFSNKPAPQELLAKGAVQAKSAKEVAKAAEVIIAMVPDTPNVEAVLFAPGGVAEGLSPGKIFVDMSSISPLETKKFARRVNDLDCEYLDAPVSGGEVGAKNATLTIMCGGNQAAFDKVKPLFELMGKNITLVGGNGDGQTCKVALSLALAGARVLGLSLPNTATCQELFNACAARGGAKWDHSAMVRALELLANHEVGQKSDKREAAD